MNWMRLSALAVSVSLATSAACAQETRWRASSAPTASTSFGVTLGRPAPLPAEVAANPFSPPPPTIVRGAHPAVDFDRRTHFLQKELNAPGDPRIPIPVPFLPDFDKGNETGRRPGQPGPLPGKPPVGEPDQDGKAPGLPDGNKFRPRQIDETSEPGAASAHLNEYGCRDCWDSVLTRTPRTYVRGEWLLWTARGFSVPVLATTSDPSVPQFTGPAATPVSGVLGLNTTQTLAGDGNLASGLRSGARFTVGRTLDPCGVCALEANFFFLTRKNDNSVFSSDQTPVIARPFFNLNRGIQDREFSATPGAVAGDPFQVRGTLTINSSSALLGAELNARRLAFSGNDFRVSALCGFRYLDLNDRLRISEDTTNLRRVVDGNGNLLFDVGDRASVFDRFHTQNRFYGGQIGVEAEYRHGRWVAEARVKLALGGTLQNITIDGGQQTFSKGTSQNFVGGLYALPSNMGTQSHSRLGFVPEVGVKLGYDLTSNVRVFVGYDFLYWSSVVRPGDQIDTTLDVNQVPNAGAAFPAVNQARPRVPFVPSSYWAHGLNAGLEIRY